MKRGQTVFVGVVLLVSALSVSPREVNASPARACMRISTRHCDPQAEADCLAQTGGWYWDADNCECEKLPAQRSHKTEK